MAKQLTRVKERYVPQQESYRNLPGLRPQAEPVRTVATPVQADDNAMRLKEMAEAFSMGNKALADFLTMEKSFEETNRVTQRARALAGLEPSEGRGTLDYGAQWGYEEGLGMAAGASLRQKFELEVIQNNMFVDLENPDPQVAAKRLNEFSLQFFKDNLDGRSEPFMMGASQDLIKARVELTSRAMDAAAEVRQRLNLNNAGSYVSSKFAEVSPRNAKEMRQFISDVRKTADKFSLTPLAMNGLAIDSIQETLVQGYNMAYDAKDTQAMNSSIERLREMRKALLLRDEQGGVSLMGDFSEGGKLKSSPLKETLKDVNKLIKDMWKESQDLQEAERKATVSTMSANYMDKVRRLEMTPEEMLNDVSVKFRAGFLDGEEFEGLTKVALNMKAHDWAVTEDPAFVQKIFQDPTMTVPRLNNIYAVRKITKDTYAARVSMITKTQAAQDRAKAQQVHARGIKDKETKAQLEAIQESNEQLKHSLYSELGVASTQVRKLYESYERQFSPGTNINPDAAKRHLETLLKNEEKAREAKVRERVAPDTTPGDIAMGLEGLSDPTTKALLKRTLTGKSPEEIERITLKVSAQASVVSTKKALLAANTKALPVEEVELRKELIDLEALLDSPLDIPDATLRATEERIRTLKRSLEVMKRSK